MHRKPGLSPGDGYLDFAKDRPGLVPAALAADLQARAFFETLNGANRYAILYRVHDA
ncbi:YdeI/OmpD-associated family protein, partial [Terrabacter sp. Soil810]|uniref:YdeI/OmpD-associated family protein n=1 Tax=Terrabacter sp. Soil810 TaxID=1736418 RepID=UPI00138F605F